MLTVQEDLPADKQSHSTGAVRAGGPQAATMAALEGKRLYYSKKKGEGWAEKFG